MLKRPIKLTSGMVASWRLLMAVWATLEICMMVELVSRAMFYGDSESSAYDEHLLEVENFMPLTYWGYLLAGLALVITASLVTRSSSLYMYSHIVTALAYSVLTVSFLEYANGNIEAIRYAITAGSFLTFHFLSAFLIGWGNRILNEE